jgi:hypothetical protein
MDFVVYERFPYILQWSDMIWSWCARVAWVALPFTAGLTYAHALDDWSRAPAIVAIVFLWAGWLGGAVALLAPRPWGFTLLRVLAPVAVVTAAWASAPASTRAIAIVFAALAAVLVLGAPVARASANALSYGSEDRYPLTVPVTLACLPLPIAIAAVAFGVVSGPLFLADGRAVAGVIALVVGFPLAALAANSLYALSKRWLVLVPAGAVIVDPLTLADPVLMPREQVAAIALGFGAPRAGVLDLRLGPARGAVTIALREPAPFVRRQGHTGAGVVTTDAVRVGIIDRTTFATVARSRRLPVADARASSIGQAAMPPPSTTSPS